MIDKKIKNKKACMGCHACMCICPKNSISMEPDQEGFLYPVVDYTLCINCNRCIEVCPIINEAAIESDQIAYACINNDDLIRLESSSGGGVVFGASFNSNFELNHDFVKTREEVSKLRGSKYLQSKIGDSYSQVEDFLNEGRKVLFVGTPCQIAGLKSYLGKIYDNLFTIDIICHGVPSPDVWRKYVEFRETEAGSCIILI